MRPGNEGPGPLRSVRAALSRILGRDPAKEADEELRFHLEMRVRDYMRAGMSEDDARAAAHGRIGNEDAIVDTVAEIDRRARRRETRRAWLAELGQDLRYGLRALRRAPAFSAVSVGTLTIGLGATTAIFSLVHAVLLAPLPYAHPDRLVRIWETSPQGATRNVVSSGNVLDWQEGATAFEELAAHRYPYGVTLTGEGDAVRLQVADVQPGVLSALGVAPTLGRSFVAEDAVAGDAVLLGTALWQSRFGADPGVLGRRIMLNDVPHTVVGVMPPGFDFPTKDAELWRPLTDDALDPSERTSHNYLAVGLLKPGITAETAQAEMSALASAIAEEHPAEMTGWGVNVSPLHADLTREARTLLMVLLAGVFVVLLIVCGNLASLLLARATARGREMAVRGAMGAGRGRILRQLIAESSLLAALGCLGATALAPVLLEGLVSVAPPDIPLVERAAIDLRMLAFTVAVSAGCALLFGLAPAARLARTDLDAALRGTRTTGDHGHVRAQNALVVGQVAFTVVLLVGAGLFVRSFRALQETDLGFDEQGLTVMEVDLPFARYEDIPAQVGLYERLLERATAVPGVSRLAGSSYTPGSSNVMTFSFAIEGRTATNPSGREDDEPLVAVTPGYFETVGQGLVEGRYFNEGDGPDGMPVVVISESLARKHWPDGGAVGSRITFRRGDTPWRTVVGIVADARLQAPDVPPGPTIYIPFAQKTWPWLSWMGILARRDEGSLRGGVAGGLRTALAEVDPSLPPQALTTVEDRFRESTARRTFAMSLAGGFGVLALLLSAVGLYGLLSYTLARQRREIGLRIAVGAGQARVVRHVLGRSLALAGIGALSGVAVALATGQALESLLFGVSPVDPATYAVAFAAMAAVALLTALGPAARAARIDPLEALRSE